MAGWISFAPWARFTSLLGGGSGAGRRTRLMLVNVGRLLRVGRL